jgi:maltose O-acetyltransferase
MDIAEGAFVVIFNEEKRILLVRRRDFPIWDLPGGRLEKEEIKKEIIIMRSEKEKMLAGELYDASDEVLSKEREYARSVSFEFNNSRPDEITKRKEILKRLIKSEGDFLIEPPFHFDYGYNIEIGDNFFANFGCVILDVNKVKIGDNVLLGPNVQIYTATHPLDHKERMAGKEAAKPIIIGNNVWIGGGTIICPGVRIGNNTTIGAGSVVTKDIPDNVLAVGNPCKVIKEV